MDQSQYGKEQKQETFSRREWRLPEKSLLVILYIFLLILQSNCQTIIKDQSSHIESLTKSDLDNVDLKVVDSNHCHSCHPSSKLYENSNIKINDTRTNVNVESNLINELLDTVGELTQEYFLKHNHTEKDLEHDVEILIDDALSKDRYEIVEGIEIKSVQKRNGGGNEKTTQDNNREEEGRALFSKFTFEYRLLQKVKNFVETHILSINLPKAARLMGFRSFGLKKFFVPLLIGAQVFKSILLAMFLPSILGSFGKILGKGISSLSAASSQASYPPAHVDDADAYNNENKDIMAYETDPQGMYAYPNDGQTLYANMADANDVNDIGNVDLSRVTMNGQKMAYLPNKNGYYKNQMQTAASNNYKVFQKIPASSMILSNYDPFYSPLLSRLDGIFARLGLAPSENSIDPSQVGGTSLSDVKLETCREQLVCLMYSSPAKYAPYSNLVSAQLSRELNELRRPVSDNPEILRFFRYMRAARRGQEGADCARAFPGCTTVASPSNTMFAAFHDINKLVTARKLHN
ncbi:uncharacterized protein LOC105389093 [Plutella xylostella]|uniref:uncharacterized protein LOC105389093 n=1 Tax=Plutella xylostella TaxID=51655 RepID=UPI002032E07B|nr:uncharacterized protein LOC105389093 [Plutella xylostella]